MAGWQKFRIYFDEIHFVYKKNSHLFHGCLGRRFAFCILFFLFIESHIVIVDDEPSPCVKGKKMPILSFRTGNTTSH